MRPGRKVAPASGRGIRPGARPALAAPGGRRYHSPLPTRGETGPSAADRGDSLPLPSRRIVPVPSVVFLNRFYAPDVAATGQILADLAEDLAAQGWDATVITGRTRYEGEGEPLPRSEMRRGVRVLRVWTATLRRSPMLGRVLACATFLLSTFPALWRVPRGSVVVAMTDPPFLLVPVLLMARLRGFQVAAWVQDVYPQLAVALGVLRPDSVLSRLLHDVARGTYRRCDVVITLAPAMSRVMTGMGVAPSRVVHVHNWADAGSIRPLPLAQNPFVREHGLASRFVVLYSGTAGRAHTFDAVVAAARELSSDPEILFLFVGGGAQMPGLRREVERCGASHAVRFLPYQPREALAASMSSGDVALVTEKPSTAGLLLPSKTYGAMASGRPILYVGSEDSDVAKLVWEHECGIVVRHDDPAGIVRAVRTLKADPELRERMGRAGRTAAEVLYDRRHATRRYGAVLDRLAVGSAPAAQEYLAEGV